jgi:phenylacetate-coenzyme A ligase PaaK-like adenylate-forming protein
MPSVLKRGLGKGLGLFPLRWVLGRNFRTNYEFVQRAQWWTRELIQEYQLEKLRHLCDLAYSHTTYYRRSFDAIGFHPGDLKTMEDFARLPTIDKSTVQEHADEMCARPISGHNVDLCTSGGTCGTPLAFYLDSKRSGIEYAYLVASWERNGFSLGTPMAVLRGRTLRADRTRFHYEYDPVFHNHYYSSFHMTEENMRRYVEHVSKIGPCFLHVYPSSVATLSRFLRRSGTKVPSNILGIIAESENVYPEQRAFVEDTFNTRMFSSYGLSEKLVLAAECEKSTDYHIWPTYGHCGLLDEKANLVTSPGGVGEIVGTGFISTVMPFIRYRTGDYATYVNNRCEACGREHVTVRDIRGHRTQEVLIAGDGTALAWTCLSLTGSQEAFCHVRQFQFYQDTPGCAVLKIVPGEGFGSDYRRDVCKFFERQLGGLINFTVELVNSIPLSPRGKAIYVDQRISEYRDGGAQAESVYPT